MKGETALAPPPIAGRSATFPILAQWSTLAGGMNPLLHTFQARFPLCAERVKKCDVQHKIKFKLTQQAILVQVQCRCGVNSKLTSLKPAQHTSTVREASQDLEFCYFNLRVDHETWVTLLRDAVFQRSVQPRAR